MASGISFIGATSAHAVPTLTAVNVRGANATLGTPVANPAIPSDFTSPGSVSLSALAACSSSFSFGYSSGIEVSSVKAVLFSPSTTEFTQILLNTSPAFSDLTPIRYGSYLVLKVQENAPISYNYYRINIDVPVGTDCSIAPASAPGAPGIVNAVATGTTTATVGFTSPASNGGSTILSYTATSSPGGITATITQAGSGAISVTGLSPSTSYTFTVTATNAIGTSSASAASNSITTSAVSASGLTPLFASGSSLDGRYTVQVSNYDSAYTYAVTSTAGQASISSTGLVTVTGLSKDQAVSVTVTTTRTGYDSASASSTGRSQVAPMTPSDKPTVTLGDTLITCTIGSYSATPTSSAFSLFVDGKHVSTIFSALGEYLPDWIIPWATSSTITRTATLTSATWTMSDAYKGKSITCATLAYSKNAIGFTASQVMVAR